MLYNIFIVFHVLLRPCPQCAKPSRGTPDSIACINGSILDKKSQTPTKRGAWRMLNKQ